MEPVHPGGAINIHGGLEVLLVPLVFTLRFSYGVAFEGLHGKVGEGYLNMEYWADEMGDNQVWEYLGGGESWEEGGEPDPVSH